MALIACGSLAALPGVPLAQDMSTLFGLTTSTAVARARTPRAQDPLSPERADSASGPTGATRWLSSSVSLVTRLSLPSPFINGAGTAGLTPMDRSAGPRRSRGRY